MTKNRNLTLLKLVVKRSSFISLSLRRGIEQTEAKSHDVDRVRFKSRKESGFGVSDE
jgi:hypothetical protein